jgi:transcriptional regulator with XRE-family HTH domain
VELGERIATVREERALTQAELAEKAGISPSTLSLIESGKVPRPHVGTVRKIARALGLEPGELRRVERLVAPKARAARPLEQSFNGLLAEERRTGYLRAWRAFVWKLVHRWEQEPPETSREIAVVLVTMQALVDEGAFGPAPEEITTSDLREASEGIDLQALFMGLRRLNAIADTVKGDETAQQRRELLEALPGGLSA